MKIKTGIPIDVPADNGSTIKMTITTGIGGYWYLVRSNDQWRLTKEYDQPPTTEIIIDPDSAWRLFSKSWRAKDVKDKVMIKGDEKLGSVALTMVSVMA